MRVKIELGDWLKSARMRLGDRSETPTLEAELLVSHVLGRYRTWVASHPEFILDPGSLDRLDQLLDRLTYGEPLPYLLGHWEFFGHDFCVNQDVLIPRPETELLVETALGWLRAHPNSRRVIDVGTGSGCIAISLASALSQVNLVATDISFKALQVAQVNMDRLLTHPKLQFIQTDLLNSLSGPFDLIAANLPYIPDNKLASLKVAEYEPRLAFAGGRDGLQLIKTLLLQSPARLATPGCILLEIEFEQGQQASSLASQVYPRAVISVLPDLSGLPRLLKIETHENRNTTH